MKSLRHQDEIFVHVTQIERLLKVAIGFQETTMLNNYNLYSNKTKKLGCFDYIKTCSFYNIREHLN